MVGAGIGGLAAALALSRKGMRVTVLEQSAGFGEIGAGVQISPNASRVLENFGLADALKALAFAPARLEMRNGRNGRLIFARELGDAVRDRFGAPYFNIHRADLHALLLDAVQCSGLVTMQQDARCVRIGTPEARPQVITADGREFTADVLVGADGIKSPVRAALFGPEQPRFTGCVAWRGLIPAAKMQRYPIAPVAALWMGPGAHFVHYYVRGGRQLNFVAVVEQAGWEVESWTERGDRNELMAAFHNWQPSIDAILAATDPDACYKWALFDRKPLPQWSLGNVTLLGDACHPTLPFMAQGACMAIEDAAVLGECLADTASIERALARYERLRKPRTANIQQTSWKNKMLYHLSQPAATMRDLGAPMMAGVFNRKLDELFEYDAFAVSNSA